VVAGDGLQIRAVVVKVLKIAADKSDSAVKLSACYEMSQRASDMDALFGTT
jgi:hypothetical protein